MQETNSNEQQPAATSKELPKPKTDFVTRIVTFLADANRLLRSIESVLIEIIAAAAPWLAPVLPAYMVHHGLNVVLKMPIGIAWTGAIVTEFLGLSAVSTTLTLWDYNDRRREAAPDGKPVKKGKRNISRRVKGLAPVWVAAGSGAFYLVVVLVVNVALDNSGMIERLAKALLSSLSVIAAMILAIRAQHARRLEAAESRRKHMQELREARKVSGKSPENSQQVAKSPESFRRFPSDWRKLSREQKVELSAMTPEQIAEAADVDPRTGREWSARLKSNGFHN